MPEAALPSPRLEDVREIADEIRTCLPAEVHAASLTRHSKLPFKAVSLRELLLHRMSSLSTATAELLEQDQVVPAAILTRSALETTALLYGLHRSIERFLSNKSEEELDQFLMKALMGSRWKDAEVQATSILTLVNHLERDMSGFHEIYDDLCEYTHPNWSGLLGAFGQRDPSDVRLRLGPSPVSSARSTATTVIWIAMYTFKHYYNSVVPNLKAMNSHFESQHRESPL